MAFWSVRFPIQTLAISIIAIVRLIASGKNTQKIPKRQAMKTVVPAVYENSCQYRYHQGTAPSIIQMRALFRPWHSVLQFPIRSDGQSTEGIVTMSRIQLTSAQAHCR